MCVAIGKFMLNVGQCMMLCLHPVPAYEFRQGFCTLVLVLCVCLSVTALAASASAYIRKQRYTQGFLTRGFSKKESDFRALFFLTLTSLILRMTLEI